MASFRFETYENVLTKHTLSKVNWTQAAQWAFFGNLNKKDWTIVSVKQTEANTLEILKRRDVNKSLCYKFGFDQQNVYERVIINRDDQTVAIDRLDVNWLDKTPFMGRRDLFMPSKVPGSVDFVRHNFWIHKLTKACEQMQSHFSAWSYRRAFRNKETINPHFNK